MSLGGFKQFSDNLIFLLESEAWQKSDKQLELFYCLLNSKYAHGADLEKEINNEQ